MENKQSEEEPKASNSGEKCAQDSSTPSHDCQPTEPRECSDSSPQSSRRSQPSDESKPQESSPTDSLPFRKESLCVQSNPQKEQGTPQSQKSPEAESKPRRCPRCNPVHVCLVLGIAVALGSIAMTACGYMSHEIAMETIVVGNDTIITINEDLRAQIEKFRTFGPVLIGLGSFISMCACVLLCEARDEAKREAKKRLEEDQNYEDYHNKKEHMYALQCKVMAGEALQGQRVCSCYHEGCLHNPNKRLDDVAYADESLHGSPVVLVHGPSLAEERQRIDSQESNESEAAKVTLLHEQSQREVVDVANIPTCSNYIGSGSEPDVETSFTAIPKTLRKGVIASSPPVKRSASKLERPSQLSPVKSKSINGPISLRQLPTADGVCLCGEDTKRAPSKVGKSKRIKRGTRQKKTRKKSSENTSPGSDSGSGKSVPMNAKSVARDNADLITHINPLHDIPLVNYTAGKSPNRTPKRDRCNSDTSTGILFDAERSGISKSLAPVEMPLDNRPRISRTSGRASTDPKGNLDNSGSVVWVKQQSRDNDRDNITSSAVDIPLSGKDSEPQRDSNSNVSTMSSMHLSPKTTPSNAIYNVIHDKSQPNSSKSEVVL